MSPAASRPPWTFKDRNDGSPLGVVVKDHLERGDTDDYVYWPYADEAPRLSGLSAPPALRCDWEYQATCGLLYRAQSVRYDNQGHLHVDVPLPDDDTERREEAPYYTFLSILKQNGA